jgi:hypothetical protein
MGLINKPDLRKVTTTVYDDTHPEMGEGIIIHTIHCNPKENPTSSTEESFRFFPNKIENGMLYRKSRPLGNGKGLDSFVDDHKFEATEVSELIAQVQDYTNFRKYRWNESTVGADDQDVNLEQDDLDPTRYRIIVRVTHKTGHKGNVIKNTPFVFVGPWVTAPSAAVGSELAFKAWKNHKTEGFFAKFPGVTCHCDLSTPS